MFVAAVQAICQTESITKIKPGLSIASTDTQDTRVSALRTHQLPSIVMVTKIYNNSMRFVRQHLVLETVLMLNESHK